LQEWGQVLIEVKYAPVTPADIYTVRLGGMYDEDSKEPPFVAGHDAVAVVAKVSSADAIHPLLVYFGVLAIGCSLQRRNLFSRELAMDPAGWPDGCEGSSLRCRAT
jgi:NADPH:quinone reductase-like Zn-dependent oxidoreductase